MKDVFLSYRRKDAETEAFLLYKDLTESGYTVFFDHKSLGGGNFKTAIEEEIRNAKNVIIFFSESSFDEKILDPDDVYRIEIATALKYNKRIVGIMLENFEKFPNELPDDIAEIKNVNCLKLYIGYYDAMYNNLVSGRFLHLPMSDKFQTAPSEEAIRNSIPKELKQLAELPGTQRMQCTQLLLQIMSIFNDSPICMRFYRYIDMYDRNKGIDTIPEYDGIIPTDLVTYLSFFETIYIIVGSQTIDISVLDFAYRFRFFAGCNVPIMQQSELLPLGYQYPNIMSLYNYWCDYIVDRYDHSVKCDRISDEIPLYENDLHKQYAAYSFAKKLGIPMRIRFLNRNLIWLNLTMRLLDKNDLSDSLALQKDVIDNILENDTKNIFEALSENEMRKSLEEDYCIGLYDGNRLTAQVNLILNPNDKDNLVLDLEDKTLYSNAAILDCVIVHQDARGFSIQKTLLSVAEYISQNNNKAGICAVTSPLNTHSIKNFLSQGYKIVATLPKYKSMRHYMWKSISHIKEGLTGACPDNKE